VPDVKALLWRLGSGTLGFLQCWGLKVSDVKLCNNNADRGGQNHAARLSAHGRVETNEYQKAKEAGRLNWFAKYCFEHNDTP
jgi:hypothetical protein